MLQKQIITELNIFLKHYLSLSFEPLKTNNFVHYRMEGFYDAIDHRRHDSNQVKVVKWFDDFYLYITVNFSKDYLQKMISISVFQGKDHELGKNQLFRAEWDDYNIDNESRPQPHWHITRDKAIYESYSELTNHNDSNEQIGFEYFEEAHIEIFDTKKIHFAMSSNWQNQDHFVHKIDDAKKVVHWMEGLLEHIKYELQN